jgi:NitT/TauT family transport system permease protein
VITLGVFIAAWWSITSLKWINPLFIPRFGDFLNSIWDTLLTGPFYYDVVKTSYRALIGLMLSSMVGIPLGLLFGRAPRLYLFFEWPVDFLRSVPSSALFPLFILFFGIGDMSKAAVVFYGCSLVLLVNAAYGAKPSREKQDRVNMLRSFGATRYQILRFAVLMDAMPHIMAGLRISVSLSLVLVIVTEMFLGATSGLGRRIYDAYLSYNIPEMYAVIVLLGILGYLANKIVIHLEARIAFWPRN